MHLPHVAVTHLPCFLSQASGPCRFESQKSIASQEWVQHFGENCYDRPPRGKVLVISSRFETEVQHALPPGVSKAVWE